MKLHLKQLESDSLDLQQAVARIAWSRAGTNSFEEINLFG